MKVGMKITIGTRKSKLALVQTHWVRDTLLAAHPGLEIAIEHITTKGDAILDRPLSAIGDKGLFVTEIEDALRAGRVDLAVHSAKDLPSVLPDDMTIAAYPRRADPRDVLVAGAGKTLADLPPGARVGTSSPRRACQLRHLRPDLELLDIRGNVDTRLRKLDEGQYDAIILACAGLKRLGLPDRIAQALAPEVMAPAIGQGALGIEVRIGDGVTLEAVFPLNHVPTHLAVEAERSLLEAFGGGCQVPLGGYARADVDDLHLSAAVFSTDGETLIRDQATGPMAEAKEVGRRLAASLKAKGADKLLPS